MTTDQSTLTDATSDDVVDDADTTAKAERPAPLPFGLVLVAGEPIPALAAHAEKVIELPTMTDRKDVAAALEHVGLSRSAIRTNVLLAMLGETERTVAASAAVIGFMGRWTKATNGPNVVDAEPLLRMGRVWARSAPSGTAPSVLTVGDESCPLPLDADWDPELIAAVRDAAVVRLVAHPEPIWAFAQLALIAGVRQRVTGSATPRERLPVLVVDGHDLDLDEIRMVASEFRQSVRPQRTAVRPRPEPTPRMLEMRAARDAVSMTELLTALGAPRLPDADDEERGHVGWQDPRDGGVLVVDADGKARNRALDMEWIGVIRLLVELRDCVPVTAARELVAIAEANARELTPA